MTACSRVRQHLTGKGNGDVYADFRAGRPVYVRLIACDERDMNAKEKYYIRLFNATASYNRTKGGGRRG